MLRSFPQHTVRLSESLDGLWEFVTADERSSKTGLPKKYTRQICVPSCWEQIPGLENYRGKAWFRTVVPGADGMAVRVVFGGVSHTARVYIDGKKAGEHYDAFTPFDVVVPKLRETDHELVIEVDNSFGKHSALHTENDYYSYGGLTRPVEIQLLPEIYIDKVYLTPEKVRGKWRLGVKVELCNWDSKQAERRVVVELGDNHVDLGLVKVKGKARAVAEGTLSPLNVKTWSADEPVLYPVEVMLVDGYDVVDDLAERVGFREVAVRGRRLLVNGTETRLKGYNRHEDHPHFGCALPMQAMINDLMTMRDLGCNFVRTCHYPNDMRFLDLCDELGFYVWEESHARAVSFDQPKFGQQIADSTREMVEWHYNRPSIIMWGCLNECESNSSKGRKVYQSVLGLLREMDPTRPVTFASNRFQADMCLDLVDIVSFNLYAAWYGGGPDNVEPNLKDLLKWIHSDESGGKGKPMIVSECGAGAIYGSRNPNRAKWTEEYQADCLDACLDVYLKHPDVIGVALWQFCDVRVTQGWWGKRPRTMNNKGTVDEYRRPKLAYDVVKQRFHAAPKRRPRKRKPTRATKKN